MVLKLLFSFVLFQINACQNKKFQSCFLAEIVTAPNTSITCRCEFVAKAKIIQSYSWNGKNKITKPNYGYKLDLGLIIPIKKQQLKWKIKPRSFSVVGN